MLSHALVAHGAFVITLRLDVSTQVLKTTRLLLCLLGINTHFESGLSLSRTTIVVACANGAYDLCVQ